MRVLYKRLGIMELGYVTDVGCALKCGEAPLNYSVLLLVNRFAERPSSVVSLQYPTFPSYGVHGATIEKSHFRIRNTSNYRSTRRVAMDLPFDLSRSLACVYVATG
jgi:hypothetical protein